MANALEVAKRAAGLARPRSAPRLDKWQGAFCEAVRLNGGYVWPACRTVMVGHTTVYERMAADPEFAKAVAAAKEEAIEGAEAVNYLRGTVGTERPVWYQGVAVGSEQEYSDGCLHKYLEAKLPSLYGRKTTLQNPDGSAFTINVRRVADERRDPA